MDFLLVGCGQVGCSTRIMLHDSPSERRGKERYEALHDATGRRHGRHGEDLRREAQGWEAAQ